MNLVFNEIRNYEKINETTVYHLIDLESNHDRKFLHDLIDEQADIIGREEESKFGSESYDEVMEEAEQLHNAVSNKNFGNVTLMHFDYELNAESLAEGLESAGYDFERSSASGSVYVSVNGKEVRISDHKRPAYDSGNGMYEEHEYDKELIIESGKIGQKELANVGIELKGNEYYLG